MVVIDDEKEQKFVEKKINPGIDYWIGLKEGDTARTYAWIDGSSLVFGDALKQYPWDSGAPNNVSNSYQLIAIIILNTSYSPKILY